MDRSLPLHASLPTCEDGEEGLLHLMRWASPGAWEVWEGRAFLYFDVLLGREVPHVDDLYAESTWSAIRAEAGKRTETELVEAVILDWMQRREALARRLMSTAIHGSFPLTRRTSGPLGVCRTPSGGWPPKGTLWASLGVNT